MLYNTKSVAFTGFVAAASVSTVAAGPGCCPGHDHGHDHGHNHGKVHKFENEEDSADQSTDAGSEMGESVHSHHDHSHHDHGHGCCPGHDHSHHDHQHYEPKQLTPEELEEAAKKYNPETLEKLRVVFKQLEEKINLPPMDPVQMLEEMAESPEAAAEGPLTAEDLLEQAQMVLDNPSFMGGEPEMPDMDMDTPPMTSDEELDNMDKEDGVEVEPVAEGDEAEGDRADL